MFGWPLEHGRSQLVVTTGVLIAGAVARPCPDAKDVNEGAKMFGWPRKRRPTLRRRMS